MSKQPIIQSQKKNYKYQTGKFFILLNLDTNSKRPI